MSFLTSKFSGYLSLILVAALAAGAWYMYQRGVTFGELQEAADTLAAIEEEQKAKQEQLARQSRVLAEGRAEAAAIRKELKKAEAKADESFTKCMDMPVPDGMRIQQ